MLTAAVVGALLVAPTGDTAGAAPPSGGEQPSPVQAAVDEAAATGTDVVVEAMTTPTELTVATADGTMRTEVSSEPVRVERDGDWLDVDLTLERRSDGTVAPRVSPADVAFSGGGATPMAQIDGGSTSMAWSWPGALPTPLLDGDTATYREVMPGVDLQVRATGGGFSEVLVVKSAEAARNPALQEVELRSTVTGGSLVEGPGGSLRVLDERGEPVLGSAPPTMWDASGGQDQAPVVRETPDEQAPGSFDPVHPAAGDQVEPVGVTVGAGTVTIEPDQGLLADPGTVFPVVIDPTVTTYREASRGMVDSAYPSEPDPNWTGTQGVGYVYDTDDDHKWHTKRLFWGMSTGPFIGKQILDATFTVTQTSAYDCTASGLELWTTRTTSTAATTWSNQPVWSSRWATLTRKDDPNAACTTRATTLEFPAKGIIAAVAGSGQASVGLALRATSENTQSSWRRIAHAATMSVTWNSPPAAPSATQVVVGDRALACTTAGTFVNSSGMTWIGTVSDPDRDAMAVTIDWDVSPARATPPNDIGIAGVASGQRFSYAVHGFAHGKRYWWRAKARDGSGAESAFTPLCSFEVDTVAPPAPGAGLDASEDGELLLRSEPVSLDHRQVVRLTSPDAGVTSFTTSVDGGVPTTVPAVKDAAPGTGVHADVTVGPFTATGVRSIAFRAVDRATNVSAATTAVLRVETTGTLLLGTDLDGTSTSTQDTRSAAGAGPVLTLTSAGRALGSGSDVADRSLDLIAAGSQAATGAAVIDTAKSFTLQATVLIGAATSAGTVLRQASSGGSAVELAVVTVDGTPRARATVWSATGESVQTTSTTPLSVGGWTRVGLVYGTSGSLRVVVGVDSPPSAPVPVSWPVAAASGPFAIGQAAPGGAELVGRVDRVRVHSGFLTATEIRLAFDRPNGVQQ